MGEGSWDRDGIPSALLRESARSSTSDLIIFSFFFFLSSFSFTFFLRVARSNKALDMTKGKKNNEKISYYISARIINHIVKHIFKNVHSVNSSLPVHSSFLLISMIIFFLISPQCTGFYRKTWLKKKKTKHIWNQKDEGNCIEQKHKLNSIN